jgi:hypothetical protein
LLWSTKPWKKRHRFSPPISYSGLSSAILY